MATVRRVRAPQNSVMDSYQTQRGVLADIERVYKKVVPHRAMTPASRSTTSHLRYRHQNRIGLWNDSIIAHQTNDDMKICGLTPSIVDVTTDATSRPMSRESNGSSLATQLSYLKSTSTSVSGSANHYPTSQTLRFLQEQSATERARYLRMSANAKTHRLERGYMVCGVKCPPKARTDHLLAVAPRSHSATSKSETSSEPRSKSKVHYRKFTRHTDPHQQVALNQIDKNDGNKQADTVVVTNSVNENKRITIHQYHTETENTSKINQWMEKNQRTGQPFETPSIGSEILPPSTPTVVKSEEKDIDADSGLKSISSTNNDLTQEDTVVRPCGHADEREINDNASENSIPTTPGFVKSVSFSVPVATIYSVPTINITTASDTEEVSDDRAYQDTADDHKNDPHVKTNPKVETSDSKNNRVYTTSH